MTTEFKVITTPRADRFEEAVTKLLNEGWELHGSPFVSQSGGMTQSMLKQSPKVNMKGASGSGKGSKE